MGPVLRVIMAARKFMSDGRTTATSLPKSKCTIVWNATIYTITNVVPVSTSANINLYSKICNFKSNFKRTRLIKVPIVKLIES